MAAVFPDWVMLDRFFFIRDAKTPLPERGYQPLKAQGSTSEGVDFSIALCLADPPATSRLYAQFASRADTVIACELGAVHGNHFLFVISNHVRSSDQMFSQDLFICRVISPDQPLLLKRFPCADLGMIMVEEDEPPFPPMFSAQAAGLLCRDEQLLAVAHPREFIPNSDSSMWEVELSVLNYTDGKDDGAIWEVKRLPLVHTGHEKLDLFSWSIDTVISFKNYICWVDYYMGGIIFFDAFKERPDVSYLDLPNLGRSLHETVSRGDLEMYRSVSVTDEGRLLKFVHVDRDDGKLFGASNSGYTITSHTLKIAEDGSMRWVKDDIMRSDEDELLPSVRTESSFCILAVPLVSMEKAHLVHFLFFQPMHGLFEKVSVVTVDMSAKKLLSTHPYMDGDQDSLREDLDMYEAKCFNPKGFLSTKFTMSDSRKRKFVGADSS